LVSPTICNLKVTKMLVDGTAGLNLISPGMLKKLQIPDEDLKKIGTFQGINQGRSQPKGKITLPVTFGREINFRIEKIVFNVVELPLPFNGILGWPALAKFMAASHYAYNTLKMPGPMGVITIPSDKRDAVICVDQMYRDAVSAEAVGAPAPTQKENKVKETGKDSIKDPEKCISSEYAAPGSNLPESSTSKRSKAAPPATKKVLAW
jgi:hypothetical protein